MMLSSLLFTSAAIFLAAASGQEIVINTNYGAIKGAVREFSDSVVIEQYLGIPYASPPIKERRWQPPIPHPKWSNDNESLDALSLKAICPQISTVNGAVIGDEDCLFLNIYVPHKNCTSSEMPLAVIVWIHGGGNTWGSSNFYDGHLPWYADVILVTLNYRLGALGFLSTGDSKATGNYGMLDQLAALQWIQENIEYFGGDKNKVTIAGESAGGMATELHVLAHSLDGSDSRMFTRIIAESGSALGFGFVTNPSQNAYELFTRLSCPTYSPVLAMECMEKKSFRDIVTHSNTLSWGPSVDGKLFRETPNQMSFDEDEVSRLRRRYDYLISLNSFDSLTDYSKLNDVADSQTLMTFMQEYFKSYFKNFEKIADAAFYNYIDWTKPLPNSADEWKWIAINVTRDFAITAPSFNFSNLASSEDGFDSDVYFYLFKPRPSEAIGNTKWAYPSDEQYDWVTGARHAEELPYVFGVPLSVEASSQAEKKVSLQMMRYYGNFARTGDPNNGTEVQTFWPKYDKMNSRYMLFDTEDLNVTRVNDHLVSEKVILWTDELPLFGEGDGRNYSTKFPKSENETELEEAIVETTSGFVKGLHLQREKYLVDRFFGIPYAKPPVGVLRFQPPQPHSGWNGTLKSDDKSSAAQWLSVCAQRNLRGNAAIGREDCLYMNIWVPGGVNAAKDRQLPVMVWIYGGGLNIGTSIGVTFYYDMERLVAQGTVVGVTFNYRLNSLGFLSTGDEEAPGNMGFLDQVEALKWIQDNIANFGGDPNKVTLFGESAGGVSVSLHMVSPISQPLFLRGISESGCIPSSWTYETNPRRQAERLANDLGCPVNSSKLLVGCLRDKPLDELVSASVGIGWNAVIDGHFLTGDPRYILEKSKDKDYLVGHNSMEGHGLASGLFPTINLKEDGRFPATVTYMSRDDVRRAARLFDFNIPPHVSEAVAYKFIEWEEPGTAYLWPRLAVTDIFTDWQFSAGTNIFADVRAESNGKGRTYIYILNEDSRLQRLFPEWVGSNHLRELIYVFGHPFEETFLAKRFNDSDRVLSLAVMTYWTNFAWSGDPNYPNKADILIPWPEYTTDTKYTIFLNTSTATDPEKYVVSNYRGDYMHMWREIMYEMWDLPLSTCPTQAKLSGPNEFSKPYAVNERRKHDRVAECPSGAFVISTTVGCVEGYQYDWEGYDVARYLGIPYAEPPTGEFRFANPRPSLAWSGTRSAKEFSKICPQGRYNATTMDEDCLHLAIYVPIRNESTDLAVMIWLHGGAHMVGDGMSSYQGDAIATLGNVIVVTVNYRLGNLGFIGTDDDAARGNYGLLDQQLAIKWVKENIANFGGNSERITIAGQSAGAQDVLLHTLSPTNDLFGISGAILQSPPRFSSDMSQLQSTITMAEETTCVTSSGNQALVDCLRMLDIEELMEAQRASGAEFGPTIDGVFLTEHPSNMMVESRVQQYAYLMGANDGDGSVSWSEIVNVQNELDYHTFTNNTFYDSYGWRTNSIDYQYAHLEDLAFFEDEQNIQKSLVEMVGDEFFIFPTHKLAQDFSQYGADVYFYYYTHPYPSGVLSSPEWTGAAHSAEIPFIFGRVLTDVDEKSDRQELSRNMIKYWTNFVKLGNPNQGSSLTSWPKYEERFTSKNYLRLDIANLTYSDKNLRPTSDAFWNDYMERQSEFCEEDSVPTTQPPPVVGDPETPEVTISNGRVRGKRVKNEFFDVHTFLGIPYAKPPLEELRFSKPEPASDWATTLEVTNPKQPCIQLSKNGNVIGSEDCLYLDVFLPTGIIGTSTNSMPILIWVHGDADGNRDQLGGSFWSGGGSPGWTESSESIDPSYLAHFGNVIVVRPNFRLGSLGFLSTGDDIMKGNFGLWDMKMVVEWSAANARNFGADPGKLTLLGQGSGATLSEMLATLSSTTSLVKRLISQSGSAFAPWSFYENEMACQETAKQVASAVGCRNAIDSESILECLRTTRAEDIVKAVPRIQFEETNSDQKYNAWGMWRLRKDGDLIPNENLVEAFLNTSFDYITGTANHEFYDYLAAAYQEQIVRTGADNPLSLAISDTYRFLYGQSVESWPEKAYVSLIHSYTPWNDLGSNDTLREAAVNYYNDLMFGESSARSLLEISRSTDKKMYQYILTRYLATASDGDDAARIGARHGDDVIYQMGIPITSPSSFTAKDREFSHTVISHWTNFAWFGNPNTALSKTSWLEYTQDETNYIHLGTGQNLLTKKDLNAEQNALWHDVIPIFNPALPQTTPISTTEFYPTEDPPICPEEIPPIGEGIGLNLTPLEADTAIYVLFSICLILGVALLGLTLYWVHHSHKAPKASDKNIGNGEANAAFVKSDATNESTKAVSAL